MLTYADSADVARNHLVQIRLRRIVAFLIDAGAVRALFSFICARGAV
jgi:hypothetical protein